MIESCKLTEEQLATVNKTKLAEYDAAAAKITAYMAVNEAEMMQNRIGYSVTPY